jgi:hypothetical protein
MHIHVCMYVPLDTKMYAVEKHANVVSIMLIFETLN